MFDWITQFVETSGYVGIALLMLAENVFPPIPSEVVMPLSGFAAARGDLNLVLVIAAGSLGSLAGAFLWYGLGYWIGVEAVKRFAQKHGRWLTLAPKDVDKADRWFDKHGGKAVLLGRMVPAVRTLISFPAGVAAMSLVPFLLYTALGTVIWTTGLALAGYGLEKEYQAVAGYMKPVSNGVIAVMVIWYLYRVATFRKRAPKSESVEN